MTPCPRCSGLLVVDVPLQFFSDGGEGSEGTHQQTAYRCLNCGNVLDFRILSNQIQQYMERQLVA